MDSVQGKILLFSFFFYKYLLNIVSWHAVWFVTCSYPYNSYVIFKGERLPGQLGARPQLARVPRPLGPPGPCLSGPCLPGPRLPGPRLHGPRVSGPPPRGTIRPQIRVVQTHPSYLTIYPGDGQKPIFRHVKTTNPFASSSDESGDKDSSLPASSSPASSPPVSSAPTSSASDSSHVSWQISSPGKFL